jgi:tRNA wybutosine-synthesizing protein 1
MQPELKKLLEKQQYRIVGEHSASKVCEYVKKSLLNKDVCYKEKFYGIKSHQCVQMTPAINYCTNECLFCWRAMDKEYNVGMKIKKSDSPEKIIDECIKNQLKMIIGFRGNKKIDWKKYEEAQHPKHFAISLSGEPTIYPKLKEMISILKKREMTSFLVTNGMFPEKLKELRPTQLYVSVFAPNEKLYLKISRARVRNAWKKLMKTMTVLKGLRKKGVRTCLRITAIKNMNMISPEKYAEIIKKSNPLFVEVKAYMNIGFSRLRMPDRSMPEHTEVKKFASEIAEHCGYEIVDEKRESRVVLMVKEKEKKNRMIRED